MTSLQKKYERLRVILGEIGISPSLPALEQVPFLSSGRKRKAQELEPKVDVDTLLSYLVMASNIDTLANQRFCAVMRSMIESHLDKEKLKSKKVKLEAIGYSLN
ncbi:hypothetical protein Tco_0470654 [Tanacetum coccineum]